MAAPEPTKNRGGRLLGYTPNKLVCGWLQDGVRRVRWLFLWHLQFFHHLLRGSKPPWPCPPPIGQPTSHSRTGASEETGTERAHMGKPTGKRPNNATLCDVQSSCEGQLFMIQFVRERMVSSVPCLCIYTSALRSPIPLQPTLERGNKTTWWNVV